ncbi:methyl-accepting chemotaxis protein [Acidovorax sp. ACV01]|uniref:methyl-accepting chemotaxis protein n=1 Tax=Acidovorax sp. ACV01 TaxID=2769311 RepID=UPI00177EBD2C|nr:methyl-accepting chemotaxis protein [Acidovorax sp. ACV01]MBD9391467.1 HAMP domain-containing protein [Acidovorax sp. ACV01]
MSLLSHLSLSRKLSLLALLALALVSLPTALYVQKSFEVTRQAVQEAHGIEPIEALLKVVQLAQQHRGMSSGVLGGKQAMREPRQAKAAEVNRAIEVVDGHLKAGQVPAALLPAWQQAKDQWRILESQVGQASISGEQSLALHAQLVGVCLQFEDVLLDHFEISLDPVFETYYLHVGALVYLPETAELLGQMRASGALMLSQGKLEPEDRAALSGLTGQVVGRFAKMVRAFEKVSSASPTFKAGLDAPLAMLRPQLDQVLALTDKQLVHTTELNYPAADYIAAYTRVIDGLFAFNVTATNLLSSELTARRDGGQRDVALMLAALAALLGVGGVLAVRTVRSITGPLRQAIGVAQAVAQGDLNVEIPAHSANDEVGKLLQALGAMQSNLATIARGVRANAESVSIASSEIAQANDDLSARTERQASVLESTASSMEQLGSAVRQNADNAQQANRLALGASSVAVKGGVVVEQVVDTMRGINDSSRKIAEIIAVIDGIAFQTNILALNAAVEAARAGEQGRGFAVVAAEVRGLAQRSANAAKEIKGLITASVTRVEQGSELVDQAGETMREIVGAIQRVTDIMGEISAASSEQTKGVEQVGAAVNQMDQTTQQNAALVEQGAAAAQGLKAQALQLVEAMAVFKLSGSQQAWAVAEATRRQASPGAPAATPSIAWRASAPPVSRSR